MAHRLHPISDPVAIEVDGEPIEAERGEPLAFALLAADRLVLGRSPKFHRPRGPTCLRGGCDGCLMRVDGEPNVPVCLVPCRGGERLETQNVLGIGTVDVLQVSDWFFPRGLDHHHLLARVPGSAKVLTSIARRMAGLGTLPDPGPSAAPAALEPAASAPTSPTPAAVDVVVAGAGLAGLSVALGLAQAGLRTFVVDDQPEPGGSLRALDAELSGSLVERTRRSGAEVATRSTLAGAYGRELLVVDPSGARVVRARALVLATGVHDGVRLFEGNDLPGVFSARAAALLAASGIAVGRRLALVGRGPYGDVLARRLADHARIVVKLDHDDPISVRGGLRVGAIVTKDGRHRVDAVVVETPGAPTFEIARQAGANVRFAPALGGYVPTVDGDGRTANDDGQLIDHLWCAGELTSTGPMIDAIQSQASGVVRSVVRALSGSSSPSLNR